MAMVQEMPSVCPGCGAALMANQPFCAHCGLKIASSDTPDLPTQIQHSFATPPSTQPYPPPSLADKSLPVTTSVRKPRRVGRVGMALIFLLLLAILVSASVLGYRYFLNPAAPTQPPISTTSLNETVTYAGIDITIISMQQATSFLDDPNAITAGMVRVNLQAQNKTDAPLNISYARIARMILPGGKMVTPLYVKSGIGLAPGAMLRSIIDFAIPTGIKSDQLVLCIGADNEAQISVPLTQQADLSKYAPKTTKLSGTFTYGGLDWTLVSALVQWSVAGKQASADMRYVILTLKVDNPLTQTAIMGSAFDYMRLKTNTTTAVPLQTTLPVFFEAGANGKTGTITFLAPQAAIKLTLTLQSSQQSGFDPATIDFQIPAS